VPKLVMNTRSAGWYRAEQKGRAPAGNQHGALAALAISLHENRSECGVECRPVQIWYQETLGQAQISSVKPRYEDLERCAAEVRAQAERLHI
jgi:hypothetical protein